MPFVFELPGIGEGVVEGELVAWRVKVGERVAVDQPLCEVMTDKATVEISSPKAGTVVALHGNLGEIIKVNTPLAEIEEGGAAMPAPAPGLAVAEAPSPTRAAPAVRRHAQKEGLDIREISGTGHSGRVTHADVEAATTAGPAPAPPRPTSADQRVKLIGLRRKIAEQMVKSKHTAPHFTYVEEVDCTRLVELRERLKARAEACGVKLSYMPVFIKACSVVFREFPNVNAVMDEAAFELVVKAEHHIGVATDTPSGLLVPVVKNVEQKSIFQIASELQDLLERTRTGKARLSELTGGTFTITGVGSIGGVLATPILNVPEVAILGVNTIRDQAVVRDGQIVVRKMMFLSPSFDHRVIDGAVGARFTAALKAVLEEPDALLMDLA